MTTGGRKIQVARISNKSSRFFEMNWTSDTPESTVALSNHAYGLSRTLLATHGLQGP